MPVGPRIRIAYAVRCRAAYGFQNFKASPQHWSQQHLWLSYNDKESEMLQIRGVSHALLERQQHAWVRTSACTFSSFSRTARTSSALYKGAVTDSTAAIGCSTWFQHRKTHAAQQTVAPRACTSTGRWRGSTAGYERSCRWKCMCSSVCVPAGLGSSRLYIESITSPRVRPVVATDARSSRSTCSA